MGFWLLFVSLLCLSQAQIFCYDDDEREPITPASSYLHMNLGGWPSQSVSAAVAKILLTEKLGVQLRMWPSQDPAKYWDLLLEYQAEVGTATYSAAVYQAIEVGLLDISLETAGGDAAADAFVIKRNAKVLPMGSIGYVGQYGWYFPSYMLETHPQLLHHAAMKTPEIIELFANSSNTTKPILWAQVPSYFISAKTRDLFNNLGLADLWDLRITDTEADLEALLAEAVKARKPFLFNGYRPHHVFVRYELSKMALPSNPCDCLGECYLNGTCDFPIDVLGKMGSRDLQQNHERTWIFLQQFAIDAEAVESIMDASLQATEHEAACEWIKSHEDIWQSWIIDRPNQRVRASSRAFIQTIAMIGLVYMCVAWPLSIGLWIYQREKFQYSQDSLFAIGLAIVTCFPVLFVPISAWMGIPNAGCDTVLWLLMLCTPLALSAPIHATHDLTLAFELRDIRGKLASRKITTTVASSRLVLARLFYSPLARVLVPLGALIIPTVVALALNANNPTSVAIGTDSRGPSQCLIHERWRVTLVIQLLYYSVLFLVSFQFLRRQRETLGIKGKIIRTFPASLCLMGFAIAFLYLSDVSNDTQFHLAFSLHWLVGAFVHWTFVLSPALHDVDCTKAVMLKEEVTLDQLLESPVGFMYLMLFAKEELSDENLGALRDFHVYRRDANLKRMNTLIAKYVTRSSPFAANISFQVSSKILEEQTKINGSSSVVNLTERVDIEIFAGAEQELRRIISKQTLPRFLTSPYFERYQQELGFGSRKQTSSGGKSPLPFTSTNSKRHLTSLGMSACRALVAADSQQQKSSSGSSAHTASEPTNDWGNTQSPRASSICKTTKEEDESEVVVVESAAPS